MTALLDLLKQKKAAIAAGNRKKTLKLADGTGRYRILPSWREGSEQFWHDFGAHYIRKPGEEKPTVYICTDKTFGRPCQVCATIAAAAKTAVDDVTVEMLSEAKSTGRVLVNALHLDGPTPNEVQILELPPTVFGQIIDIMTEWVDAGENPIEVGPGKGKDFLITRTGKGKQTKYTTQVAAKTTSISRDLLKTLNNLDEYVATENAEAELRALNAVKAAAGLLTAPTTAAGVAPSRLAPPAAATTIVEEDEYAVAAPPARRAKPVEEFEDVPDSVTEGIGTKAVATSKAAEVVETGDPELDELLKSLP